MRAWAAALALGLGAAGPPPADPDWPCVQRLVPTLSAASLWQGDAPAGDWRADDAVAALVAEVSPRGHALEAGVARLRAFAAAAGAGKAALAFHGLVDETNEQRGRAIDTLKALGRRQREVSDQVRPVSAELNALPPDAPEETRAEIKTRRAFMIRDYEEVGRTIRYACEVPVQLEARLGAFAEALRSGG